MTTKIGYSFTEEDLIERKIVFMIQPIDNNTRMAAANLRGVARGDPRTSLEK